MCSSVFTGPRCPTCGYEVRDYGKRIRAIRAELQEIRTGKEREPSQKEKDRWYGMLDFGTAVTKPKDLGSISLDFLPMRGPRVYLPVTYRDYAPPEPEPTAEPEPTLEPEPTSEPEP